MEGLGALGFWLFVGIVIAAFVVAGGLREREKERTKQATLRALLEKGSTPEVLEYLREKDAAEQKLSRDAWGTEMGPRQIAGIIAFMVFIFSLIGGLATFAYLAEREPPLESWLLPVGVMFAVWLAGLAITGLLLFVASSGRKNAPPPGA